MNAEQKKFIESELIPFILRAEGNGFMMEAWKFRFIGEEEIDGVIHKAPPCGTAACIGGSLSILRPGLTGIDTGEMAKFLGLSYAQTDGLFYGWDELFVEEDDVASHVRWPKRYRDAFLAAGTPLAKAQVAVALLKEVVATEGQCLEGN